MFLRQAIQEIGGQARISQVQVDSMSYDLFHYVVWDSMLYDFNPNNTFIVVLIGFSTRIWRLYIFYTRCWSLTSPFMWEWRFWTCPKRSCTISITTTWSPSMETISSCSSQTRIAYAIMSSLLIFIRWILFIFHLWVIPYHFFGRIYKFFLIIPL